MPPSGRRRFFALLALVVGILVTVLLVELLFRTIAAPPRVAMVTASRVKDYHVTRDGILLWRETRDPPVRCSERRPGAPRVSLFGSSIVYGAGLSRDQALSARLEAQLVRSLPGGACVDDFAQPGFGADQEYALARETIPETHPLVAVWEIWDPAKHYSVVGDIAFDGRSRALDPAGVPVLPKVPAFLADTLFRWSAAYRYAALAIAPEDPRAPIHLEELCTARLPEVERLLEASGGRLVVLTAARLDRPLRGSWPDGPEEMVASCAKKLGVPVLSIAELLADQRVEDVRSDTCCHLNALGHALLGERLAPELTRVLAAGAR